MVEASQATPMGPVLEWRDGDVPASRRYGDVYYSMRDGLAETRHVYLGGNELPRRMAGSPAFAVAELGFGTGLGFLAAWSLWRHVCAAGGVLVFTSFEVAPLKPADMARAHRPWPELTALSGALIEALSAGDGTRADLGSARLRIVLGDARATVPRWHGRADAWFLDGFAPARNPEMWEPALLRAVHDRTTAGGTAATFSAAGAVRRALADSGFAVSRAPGFGRKRHMLRASRAGSGLDVRG